MPCAHLMSPIQCARGYATQHTWSSEDECHSNLQGGARLTTPAFPSHRPCSGDGISRGSSLPTLLSRLAESLIPRIGGLTLTPEHTSAPCQGPVSPGRRVGEERGARIWTTDFYRNSPISGILHAEIFRQSLLIDWPRHIAWRTPLKDQEAWARADRQDTTMHTRACCDPDTSGACQRLAPGLALLDWEAASRPD
jgi:hypothetical protein